MFSNILNHIHVVPPTRSLVVQAALFSGLFTAIILGYDVTYITVANKYSPLSVAYPGILFAGKVQQIQLRTEDRENGDLGAVAP